MTKDMKGTDDATPASFESALEQLQEIVDQLERGELTLEESVSAFERGTRLLKACSGALSDAEKRVKSLIESEGGELLEKLFDEETNE